MIYKFIELIYIKWCKMKKSPFMPVTLQLKYEENRFGPKATHKGSYLHLLKTKLQQQREE